MKKFAAASVLALALTACQTPGTGTGTPTDIVASVTAITQQACGFLPLANTVIQIINLGSPELATASAIASAICAQASAPRGLRAARVPTDQPQTVGSVRGVPVRGTFQ